MTAPLNNPCPEPVTCSIAVELEKLRGEMHSLGEIVKASMASTEAAFERGEKVMEDLDIRTDKIEKKIWWVSGAAAGAASVITGALTYGIAFLKMKNGGGHGGP